MKIDFLFAVTARRVARFAILAALPMSLGACEWFTDFKAQPSLEPWQSPRKLAGDSMTPPRGNPLYSIPIQGTVSPAAFISYERLPATIDSFSVIPNPTAPDARSLANGRMYYQINCSVCHGRAGNGMGTIMQVNKKYSYFSISLVSAVTQARTDGYIYGMIRNGRGMMPSYNRIEERDRWDVVNYVRALQGKAGAPADTTPPGMPGQNGTTVPGPSFTAPTRPVPYVHPVVQQTPGSSGINSATYRGNNDGPREGATHDAPGGAAEKAPTKGVTTPKSNSPAEPKKEHQP